MSTQVSSKTAARRASAGLQRPSEKGVHFEVMLLRLLSTFLSETPHPRAEHWLQLSQSNPDLEVEIVEFALSYASLGRVSVEHLPVQWRVPEGEVVESARMCAASLE